MVVWAMKVSEKRGIRMRRTPALRQNHVPDFLRVARLYLEKHGLFNGCLKEFERGRFVFEKHVDHGLTRLKIT